MGSTHNRPPRWAECVIRHSIDGDYRDRREYLRLVRMKYSRHIKMSRPNAAVYYILREVGYWVLVAWPLRILKWSTLIRKIAK